MTRDEHRAGIIALQAKAQAAADDERWTEAMLISSDVAELLLEHPEFWPDHVDHTKLRTDCERMIARIDKALGIR